MGLIVAENSVDLSKDYGQTKTRLPNLPGLHDACMVSVNESTIFLAGGYSESEQIIGTYQSSLVHRGASYRLVDNKGLDGKWSSG